MMLKMNQHGARKPAHDSHHLAIYDSMAQHVARISVNAIRGLLT